jgi:peptidoglycan/LPS O-acetylase OafA/YrhL
MSKRKINFDIEGLRGIAIVLVLIQHFPSLYFWSDHVLFKKVNEYIQFWSGVDLFFCISGFVVCGTVSHSIDAAKNSQQSVNTVIKQFFIKRIFRILPTSWLWVGICLILTLIYNSSGAFGEFRYNLIQAFGVLTYTFNAMPTYMNQHGIPVTLAPYWSLTLEEQFYLIFPFFLLYTKVRMRIIILVLLIFFQFGITRQGLFIFNFRIDAITWGVLLNILRQEYYYLYEKLEPKSFGENNFLKIVVTLTLLLILTLGIPLLSNSNFLVGILALTSALLVYMASFDNKYIYIPFRLENTIRWFGSRSFGIYIIHMPVIYIVQETTVRILRAHSIQPTDSILLITIMTISTLILIGILVELNYRTIEGPLREYGREKAKSLSMK